MEDPYWWDHLAQLPARYKNIDGGIWTWIIIAKSLYKFCVGDQIHVKCIINIEMEQYISIQCAWQANRYFQHWSYNNEDKKLKTSYQLLNHVLITTIHKLWKIPIPFELDVFWWTWWWPNLLQKDGTPYTHNKMIWWCLFISICLQHEFYPYVELSNSCKKNVCFEKPWNTLLKCFCNIAIFCWIKV